MVKSACLAGFCALVSVAGVAGARSRPGPLVETSPAPAALVLVDDRMIEEDANGEDWRLPTDTYDRESDGDLRLRVKVRPNRAMGRMSLAF